MYLLHLQGKLNHLSRADKVYLFNAVNLWIRNIVIKQHVEDLQLDIQSYQTKLNFTQLIWDATDFQFKEDYTIFYKARVIIYKDRNNQKKMIRETKVYKFSDGTLTRILERKEDIEGNFKILYNIGGLKHMNALVDQGSDVNTMPLSIYKRLTNERPTETDIRLSLASHSYIYPLGLADEVLVDIVGYVYPMDFMILDISEDEKRPFILGTLFLTTAKVVIKFDKGTITLKSGKSKISFHKIPEPHYRIEKGIKNDIEPIAPTMTVNRLVLEWDEKIKLHQEKEMKFDQWQSKIFSNERPASVEEECKLADEGGVT
nr:hypothetical protein [Tanacetum cinerariifolium]